MLGVNESINLVFALSRVRFVTHSAAPYKNMVHSTPPHCREAERDAERLLFTAGTQRRCLRPHAQKQKKKCVFVSKGVKPPFLFLDLGAPNQKIILVIDFAGYQCEY